MAFAASGLFYLGCDSGAEQSSRTWSLGYRSGCGDLTVRRGPRLRSDVAGVADKFQLPWDERLADGLGWVRTEEAHGAGDSPRVAGLQSAVLVWRVPARALPRDVLACCGANEG